MRRLLQWQFVVPRVLLVVVVLLAVQYVCGLAARSIAVRSGAAVLGARVELAHARVSLSDRRVVFNDVRIVKASQPTGEYLEADRCEFTVASGPLLHKQVVVDSGHVSGLRFGAAATSSADAGPAPIAWFKDDSDVVARKWLDRLGDQFTLDMVKDVESVERTEALYANWSKQSAALESRLEGLDARAAALQELVEATQANPLRNYKVLADIPKKVSELQSDFKSFRAEVERLPDRLESERREIIAARRHDGEGVSKRLRLETVDANALTAYLLREQTAKQLDQLVDLLRWVREVAPVKAKPQADGVRGEDVLFAGCRRGPGLLIRSLQLEGAARVAGQPVKLRGVLMNLASDPTSHNQPTRLRLVGSGSMPLELQATIDRTGLVPRDEVLVDCQGVLVPAVGLGQSGQLKLGLAPSVGALSVSVVVEGDKLSGDIQIVQQKVQITPVVHGPGSEALTAAMGETLGRVNSVATRIALSGTLDDPTCNLWSNLGSAVAEAMNRALLRAGEQHSKALLVEAQRQVDERLAEVDRQVAEKQAKFASRSNDLTARLQKIASAETPRYRISAEQGGHRLPNNSLFR